jgi:protein-tyrosine phosphatase
VGTPGRVLRNASRGGLGEGPGANSRRADATAEKPVVTSASAPCTVTWLSNETGAASCHLARFGLSVCPGKRINGRDGKVYARSLEEDLRQLRDDHNVTLMLNLLNESELRSLGVSLAEYKKHTAALGMTLLQLPCVEMAPFECPEKVWEFCNQVEEHLAQDALCRVVVHCRGGVGRAGTFAACYLLHRMHEFAMCVPGQSYGPRDAIAHVRKRRCPRAIESRKQEDFVDTYAKLLMLRGLPTTPVSLASTRPSTFESTPSGLAGVRYAPEPCENLLQFPALDLVACAE